MVDTATRPIPTPISAERAAEAGELLSGLLARLERVLLGQREVLEHLVVAWLAGGHALLEGVPGVGKTLAALALARALDVRAGRIQFTPDLMPSDVTGVSVLNGEGRFEFRPGPVFADLLLADEINRAPAKTQSALLEAMQERRVTVDGVAHPLGPLFTVFATQNPIEYEGTLPEAQLDRFLVHVRVGYPAETAERDLLAASLAGFEADDTATYGIDRTVPSQTLLELRRDARLVRVEPTLSAYIVQVVRATREDVELLLGASPRAAVALLRAVQAAALLEGRDFATPEDVAGLAPAVLGHRVRLRPEAALEGMDSRARVRAVLERVPAPR
jgi:MoxR-like ATPase